MKSYKEKTNAADYNMIPVKSAMLKIVQIITTEETEERMGEILFMQFLLCFPWEFVWQSNIT